MYSDLRVKASLQEIKKIYNLKEPHAGFRQIHVYKTLALLWSIVPFRLIDYTTVCRKSNLNGSHVCLASN